MRHPFSVLSLAALAACGGERGVVSGELGQGAQATEVWVLGGPGRAALQADTFTLPDLESGALDLRFSDDGEVVARMEIADFAGKRLRLREIWFEDGVAYPLAVESDASSPVRINGMRMTDPGALPDRLDARAAVLAVSRDGSAMIVRPSDESLPDLRVVVTPGTRVATSDGGPASVESLEFGDSVRVTGAMEGGYLVAADLILPRGRVEGVRAEGATPAASAAPSARSSPAGPAGGDRDRGRRPAKGEKPGKEKPRGPKS